MSQIIHLILKLFYLWAKFCNWKSPEHTFIASPNPFIERFSGVSIIKTLFLEIAVSPFVSHSTLVESPLSVSTKRYKATELQTCDLKALKAQATVPHSTGGMPQDPPSGQHNAVRIIIS